MYRHILIPLDGSLQAERALPPVLELVGSRQARLTLLRVPERQDIMVASATGYDLYWPDQSLQRAHEQARTYLNSLRSRHLRPDLIIRTRVVSGDVAGVILDTAHSLDVDLIAMSTHGRSGLSHWVFGSITERVLRAAPCPVLVVRHEKPIQHLLITLDGSRLAEEAVAPAMEVARALGCRVTLLCVAREFEPELVTVAAQLERAERGLGERLLQSAATQAENYLESFLGARPQLQAGLPAPVQTVVLEGPAAAHILAFAGEEQVDLIAMATHGRTGLKRWVYGSVTEKVLRRADCSLLVVRPPASELH